MASNVKNSNLIVGLDIGTSKVVCIVGKYNETNDLEIVALGSYPSSGLKRGIVVNIDATTDAIKKAVDQAQSMIEEKIKNVFVGIAGNHVKSLNSHGTHGIKDNEVSSWDLEKVNESAQAMAIPSDQRVLHVIPQKYVIDGQEVSLDPLGMSGVRLESKVHLVTCAESAMKNIEKCVRNCGLTVERFVLEQLASSYSILSEDEKDLGVCLVDIGGGTTDIAIFKSGAIQFTGVLPIAGDQVFGYISVNEGIKVHKKDCPNSLSLQSNFAYRIIKAKWVDSSSDEFTAILKLSGIDNIGIVSEVTKSITGDMSININKLSFDSEDGVFTGLISVNVKNKTILNRLINRILKVKGVDKVLRE